MGYTGRRNKFVDIFSRLDTVHKRDGQTQDRSYVSRLEVKMSALKHRNVATKSIWQPVVGSSSSMLNKRAIVCGACRTLLSVVAYYSFNHLARRSHA